MSSPSSKPMISCVMPTRDRPRLFQQAVKYFLDQSYAPAELIVVDDGEVSVEPLCADDRIRHVRLSKPAPTGSKMNIGFAQARGEIFQKLDDDDFYHRDFLGIAAEALRLAGIRKAIVAWNCFLVLYPGEDRLLYSGTGWRAGATLCFPRELWLQTPFQDSTGREDALFLEDANAATLAVRAPEHFVVIRHGRNTWRRTRMGRDVESWLRSFQEYPKRPAEVLGEANARFYRELAAEGAVSDRGYP